MIKSWDEVLKKYKARQVSELCNIPIQTCKKWFLTGSTQQPKPWVQDLIIFKLNNL